MHIQAKQMNQYPWYLRIFYSRQKRKLGQVLNPGLLWGRMPRLEVLFLLFWGFLDRKRSPIDPALRALVQVYVAKLNWCQFCIDLNSHNFFQRSHSMEKIEALDHWRESLIYSEREVTLLEYVEILCSPRIKVTPELMAALKAHFDDDQIVELTALIAFQNMSAKFNAGLDIPSQGLCQIETSDKRG